jgi:PAS domain S-box-containing protein
MDSKDQHARIFSVFMQAPFSISVLDGPEHVVVFSNPEHEKLFHGSILGKTIRETMAEAEGSSIFQLLDRVYESGDTVNLKEAPVMILDVNGDSRKHFLDLTYNAFRNSDGDITGVVAVTSDATERVIARMKVEELERITAAQYREFDTLLAGVPDPLILFDLEGQYKYCNRAALESFGLAMETMLGKPFRTVNTTMTPESITLFETHLETIRITGVAIVDEFSVVTPKGLRSFEYCLDGIRDANGIIEGFTTASRDITDRSEYQNARNTVIEQLNEERELRETFVGTLTHDMRTPLTAVKMLADLIDRKFTDHDFVHKASQKISTHVMRLDRMIRDLLDANRIKVGEGIPLYLGKHQMDQVLESAISELSIIYGPRFKYELVPITGIWDSSGIQRILENLLGNAVKYGRVNSPITVRLKQIEKSVEIEVHNEGDPISLEDQKTLFKQYKRTNSANSGIQKGWGIGLSLVKGVAEAHGGSVRVSSSDSAGTSFFVKVPLITPPHD